jgi:serine/threonine protein kinase
MEKPEQFVGNYLGQYKLVQYLGYGAMARVYKAFHTELRRNAAIKVLHPHFSSDPDFLLQFKAEAQNLARLRHPNIVQVYDASVAGNYPYLVMEFIDGITLKFLIEEYREKRVRIPLIRTLRTIYSVGLALAYAHQRNIIHRDVKPSNIMIEESGRVVLADFGLARLTTRRSDTETGTIKGTPAYMAPEQALGRASNPRSDIYSLGVIFYELLTGRQPYSDENPLAIAMKHVSDPLIPPRAVVPEIPEEVEKIVLRAMIKNPNERYSTAKEYLQDLTKVRLQIKTTRLPTASLSSLQLSSDKIASWTAPNRPGGRHGLQVCMHFIDTGQILNLGLNREYTIGRKHKSQPIVPDIDLSPFKAFEWGISRLHASVSVQEEELKITDIGSSNGTWHAGKRLVVNHPYKLVHGDIVYLGKLKVQFLIYHQ